MHISQSTDGRVFWRVQDDVRQVQGAIISNTACSGNRVRFIFTCSERQRYHASHEIKTQTGDVFEIEATDFGLVLRNPLGHEITDSCYQVGQL